MRWRVLALLPLFSVAVVLSDYFTASDHLRDLLLFEIQLKDQLKDYIKNEETRISRLRNLYAWKSHIAAHTSTHHAFQANTSRPRELGTSTLKTNAEMEVTRYQTIKKKHKEWRELEFLERKKLDILRLLKSRTLPSEHDLRGAQDAILRLQGTFSLSPTQISQGIVSNASPHTKLGASDAFDIGIAAFHKNTPIVSHQWLLEALRILDGQSDAVEIERQRIDFLPDLLKTRSVVKETLNLTSHLSLVYEYSGSMDEVNNTTKGKTDKKTKKRSTLKKRIRKKQNGRRKKYPQFFYTPSEDVNVRRPLEIERGRALCRGETDPIPRNDVSKLLCWNDHGSSLLKLKPAYVERIYNSPELLIYRNAITDTEIDQLKDASKPKLYRVHNPALNSITDDYRTSESAWLKEDDIPVVLKKLNRRIEAYTGLDLSTAEPLQIANYGLGGHYDPHFDFGNDVSLRPPPWKNRTDLTKRSRTKTSHTRQKENGDRIATLLIYMSDVEIGGSTVFTNLGQAVQPSKGDALFWYNLNHDGSGDYQSRHAACPVLIGEKWVANKWIHERGQEFRRPCKLRPEDD